MAEYDDKRRIERGIADGARTIAGMGLVAFTDDEARKKTLHLIIELINTIFYQSNLRRR
ncbi:MAG: hypothetical protein LBT08_03885 [Synergistaceae bacterium]|jgi:hypothetical protein|nr:hypothetical protein [Synergistaceae bacterium]